MLGWRCGLVGGVLLAGLAGCGGDDSDGGPSSSSGGGSSDGGSGGAASTNGGSGGTAGSSGGSGGSGGSQSDGSGGTGGSSGGASGGSGGGGTSAGGSAGAAGAGPEPFAPITEVTDVVIDEVNEIRGLTFGAGGKIWGSGFTDVDPDNRQLAIVRFTADGELDTSFDEDGVLVFDIGPGDEQSRGIVELANGDIIVQANIPDGNGGTLIEDTAEVEDDQPRPDGTDVVLLRFDASGALVTGFGNNGMVTVHFGWSAADDAEWPVPSYDSSAGGWSGDGFPADQSWGIGLDTSGDEEKVVVFGYGPAPFDPLAETQRFDNDRYIARVLASDGSPDPEFNDTGVFSMTTPGEFSDGGRRGVVEADGSILSAGYTNFGEGFGNHGVLLRVLEDGTPDEDFGFGIAVPGATRFNPFVDDGGMAECYALGRQSNGRIVTTGYGYATASDMTSRYGYATSQAQDLVSFGVLADGLDLDWGNQGTLAIQSEEAGLGDTQDRGRDLVVLADDRVVHAGRFGPNPALFVTTPDGELDTGVGDGGKFLYEPFQDTSHFYVIAANQDKTRIAAATSNHPQGVVLAILEVANE